MESIAHFRRRVAAALADVDRQDLYYNRDEFWMIRLPYEFMEHFAESHRLYNTALALPLMRGLHNGSYRKSPVIRNGQEYRPPYAIHCLTVCKMLADMWLPITDEEKDILLASALCHDMIEDVDFPQHGWELVEKYHLAEQVYDTVRCVSKRRDFTAQEEREFFSNIQKNKLALLIKLSDRGHNVTDLFNMSDRKIQEYIGETRTFFLPMCEYAREHYPELSDVIEILHDQMIVLTKTTEAWAARYAHRQEELKEELGALREENEKLRQVYSSMRKEAEEL